MFKLSSLLGNFPAINPFIAFGAYLGIPLIAFTVWQLWSLYREGLSRVGYSFKLNVAIYVHKFATKLFLVNFLLALLLCWNQAAIFFKMKVTFGTDISYYLRVNSLEYDNSEAISLAASLGSFAKYTSSTSQSTARKLLVNRRRLSSEHWMTFFYHTESWNTLTPTQLQQICKTEYNILSKLTCLNGDYYESIIPSLYESRACKPLSMSQQDYISILTSYHNSGYLKDNVDRINPQSPLIISYMRSATCGSLTVDALQSQLMSLEVGDVKVAFIESTLLNKEFLDAVINAVRMTIVAVILSSIVLVVGLQGIICTLVTIVCIIASLICAAGVLPFAAYGSFSAFNVMSIFILVGVGATTVLLFAAAWRDTVPSGVIVTPHHLLIAYSHIGQAACFTAMATLLSLFSKMASPVIVISQLGVFMGTAYVVFFVLFHYVIIPAWLVAARYPLPPYVRTTLQTLGCGMFLAGGCSKRMDHVDYDNDNDSRAGSDTSFQVGAQLRPVAALAVTPLDPPLAELYSASDGWRGDEWYSSVQMGGDDDYGVDELGHANRSGAALQEGSAAGPSDTGPAPPDERLHQYNENEYERSHRDYIDHDNEDSHSHSHLPPPVSKSVRAIGCFGFIASLVALLLVYLFSYSYLEVDFGIPQLFPPTSNMGQALIVAKYYKATALSGGSAQGAIMSTGGSSSGGASSSSPTSTPIRPPAVPSPLPSMLPAKIVTGGLPSTFPSAVPSAPPSTIPSARPASFPILLPTLPTLVPVVALTRLPSPVPTISPSSSPSARITAKPTPTASPSSYSPTYSPMTLPLVHTDYTVTGCWGIHKEKRYIDSDVEASKPNHNFRFHCTILFHTLYFNPISIYFYLFISIYLIFNTSPLQLVCIRCTRRCRGMPRSSQHIHAAEPCTRICTACATSQLRIERV